MNVIEGAHIERFRSIISERLGLQFEDEKLDMLADVLRQRLQAQGKSPGFYFSSLEASQPALQELRTLASLLTISETYFFRAPEHFRAFTAIAVPQRVSSSGSRPLRILSAGCASGDEAYSIAISLREEFPGLLSRNIAITGVDVNPVVLSKARQAEYSAWSLRDTDEELKRKYFRAEGRNYLLDKAIRALVRFEEGNIAVNDGSVWDQSEYDVIFCRNVIMYLVPEAARTAVARLSKALLSGGFLFLSHAETLRGISQDFHLRHTHDSFYYEKRDDVASELVEHKPFVSMMANFDLSWVDAVQRTSDRIQSLSEDVVRQGVSEAVGVAVSAPSLLETATKGELGVALDLLRREKYVEALEALAQMAPERASDGDAQLLRAVLLTNSGRIAAAEDICQRLLKSDELNANAHYLTALCREHANDLDGAIEHDRTAIYVDSSFSMAHLHLALLSKRAGDVGLARRELEQAESLLLREDAARILLLGGGFSREALTEFCHAQLRACGGGV
jgi:chemotaxis protein methyltransferase CheR